MRQSGILLHISSLPSPYGIGDLGPHAYGFIDFLSRAGQQYWQVLPVNPTDGINGHSPYSCFSAFAGNPLFISPQSLVVDGFITAKDLKKVPAFPTQAVDYPNVIIFKNKLFDLAFSRWEKLKDKDTQYHRFCKENGFWLDDYAVFVTAKSVFKGQCWNQWPQALKVRQPNALKQFSKKNAKAIEKIKFIQFLFFCQWYRLKRYAQEKKVKIIGDIPIYVNYDSADVWCYRKFFKLTPKGDLKFVSGCPPDYFSKTGQRWGNPVYDWAALKKDKYRWWQKRIEHNLKLFDLLRIDHFRGFESFWEIPAQERLAVFGKWVKAPGKDFFTQLTKSFKGLPLIAEDLGEITQDVIRLMKHFKFPGMRVLLFGFGGNPKENPHVPMNYTPNCVAYTGTHDNNTIKGWVDHEAKPYEMANVRKILRVKGTKDIHWVMIKALFHSKAGLVIIPLADLLGLGQEARMNTPSTTMHNWQWRYAPRQLTKAMAPKLLTLTKASRRVS